MRLREFGRTGEKVSETGFGAWAIGGGSYGPVDRGQSLQALARAEELGCNIVDTAAVYGDSEDILGEFLRGRRQKWLVATKFSGQAQGLTATAEAQLRRLGIEAIDFYQIHWVPGRDQRHLYDDLRRLKESGKVRFVGVSLYSQADIDRVLSEAWIDGFQVAFGLLDPRPFVTRLEQIRKSGIAVVVRSCLKGGFLTGKYGPHTTFSGSDDQRAGWGTRRIAETAAAAERFRFLEEEAGSLLNAAVSYPLGFDEVSTVLLSTKDHHQASLNYGLSPTRFHQLTRDRISRTQEDLGLLHDGVLTRLRRSMSRVKRLIPG